MGNEYIWVILLIIFTVVAGFLIAYLISTPAEDEAIKTMSIYRLANNMTEPCEPKTNDGSEFGFWCGNKAYSVKCSSRWSCEVIE